MSIRGAALRACALAAILVLSTTDGEAKPTHGAGHAPKRSVRLAGPARSIKAPHHAAHAPATPVVTRKKPRPHSRLAAAAHIVRHVQPGQLAARLRRAALPLVLIDPGHGGRDCGAVGITGLLEKDVTLSTALELQRELRAQGRYRVELTRTADVGISLANRAARARSQQPALLISIHADASSDPRAHGASVYVRSEPGQGETVKLPASPAASRAISRALSTGTPNPPPGSSYLQNAVVEQLKDDVAMMRDPAREAHLYVLSTAGVPSVLVEMGFVSNRQEERLLRTTRYRRTVANAIRDAIGDYFNKTMYRMAGGS